MGAMPKLSPVRFSLWVAVFLAATANVSFWQKTAAALWAPTGTMVAFFGALALLLMLLPLLMMLLLPAGWPLKVGAMALVGVASIAGHYMDSMGTPMTGAMLRNVLETDAAEVHDLITPALLLRVALLGLLPIALIARIRFAPVKGWRAPGQRLAVGMAVMLGLAGCLTASSQVLAVFLREHKVLRSYANPTAPMWNFFAALQVKRPRSGPLLNPAADNPVRTLAHDHRIFVLVLGETVRAANFALGGYSRDTTPQLRAIPNLTYFPDVQSCGTSTAESVPCLFSHLGRSAARNDRPDRYENLLDSLTRAGLDVVWIDNNSGCKGVCDRVRTISFMDAGQRARYPALCQGMLCWDEILTRELAGVLQESSNDLLVVLHQIGSHGPAYSERYPPAFGNFQPACQLHDLTRCNQTSLINAYDNTILYTDYNLAETIKVLDQAAPLATRMLLYVSDHGESLGEAGVYLHGLPRAFAPKNQTHVPMLTWMPKQTAERLSLSEACFQQQAFKPHTHDQIYSTIAGYFGFQERPYQTQNDLLAPCTDQVSHAISPTPIRVASRAPL